MKIDRYDILDKLGSGGFGDVYRARHVELGREDAIKVLHFTHSSDPTAFVRFVTEARAASRVDHPGIVRVYDVGLTEDSAYCVMELLEGKTLRALLDERGPLPITEAFALLTRIASALDAAHEVGVVHRDLKPENVIVQRDGSPKLIDFGLARLVADESMTTTGRVMGSPRYMSPEQCRGKPSDSRSDAYSFGALAYHLLVGQPPFDGDVLALALHHLNDEPIAPSRRRPDLPKMVDAPLRELLHKDPARRPERLADAVERMQGNSARSSGRWRWLWVAAGLLVVLGGSATYALRSRSAPERTPWVLVDQIDVNSGDSVEIGHGGRVILVEGNDSHSIALTTHTKTPLPDGGVAHLLDHPRVTVEDETLWLGEGTSKRALADHVKGAQLSHDQKTIAVVRNDAIELVSLATLQHRMLTSVAPATQLAQWSGDDKVLSWTASEITELTTVSTGITRALSLPLIQDLGQDLRVALIDENRLVYCSDEGGHRAIRVRSTEAIGDSGQLVRELEPETATCEVTVDGHRVAIAATRGRPQVGVFDLRTRSLRAASSDIDVSLRGVSRDGQEFLVDNNKTNHPDAIDRRTSVRTSWWIGSCGGGPVQWGSKWGYLKTTRSSSSLELTDDTCRSVAYWKLPRDWIIRTVCRMEQCLELSLSDKLRIWSLVPNQDARMLAELPASEARDYEADLSRDGRHFVVTEGENVHVIGPDGVRNLPNYGGHLQGAVWDPDSDDLIVSGVNVDGANYVVLRVHPDGSRELLHGSSSDWFQIIDRANGEVFGALRSFHSTVFVYDMAL